MHIPVLLEETLSYLVTDPEGTYVDGTLGGGGHFQRLLEKTGKKACLIGIDRDKSVLEETGKKLSDLSDRTVHLIHDNYSNLSAILDRLGVGPIDGIMLDLGVSSFQLDEEARGFSYHADAKLDMRMDASQDLSAEHVVNSWPEEKLAGIIRDYGEEKNASRIARAIIKERQVRRIETTGELVNILKRCQRGPQDKHPARRTFQALRIAVNDELGGLTAVLPQIAEQLKPGGRLCIITFHSLEDRIVKEFVAREASTCVCPPRQPVCTCHHQARLKPVFKKPLAPSAEEIDNNPRARSAKLRVAERIQF